MCKYKYKNNIKIHKIPQYILASDLEQNAQHISQSFDILLTHSMADVIFTQLVTLSSKTTQSHPEMCPHGAQQTA